MTYNYSYTVCALLFLLIVFERFFTKRQFPSKTNRIFAAVLVVCVCDLSLDIITAFTIEHALQVPIIVNTILMSVFYTTQIVLPVLMFYYALILTGKADKKHIIFICASMAPAVLQMALVLLNPITHSVYVFGTDGSFTHENGFITLYVCTGVYLAATLLLVGINRRNITRTQFVTIYIFVAATFGAIILQYYYPWVLLTGVAIALSVTLMYFTLENPDDMVDSTSGVFNRQALLLFLRDKLAAASPMQLIVVRIENLSKISSVYGTDNANAAFNAIASFMSGKDRSRWVFRFDNSTLYAVMSDAKKYRDLVKRLKVRFSTSWNIKGCDMSISALICCLPSAHVADNAEELVALTEGAAAEIAMGTHSGICEIDSALLEKMRRRTVIETALREAIVKDRFEIYFQPIYSCAAKRFVSAEALLRLRDPALGFISPAEFIPIAENDGLILKIDEIVLRKVCEFARNRDLKQELGLTSLEINLSGVEFMREKPDEHIASIIDEYGVNHSGIVFEITETVATVAFDSLNDSMSKLCRRGFRFALDDFGTGYANITNVVKLPFAMVKLDRSMLISTYESRENALVFEDMLSMFGRLGKTRVVEGVETEEQVRLLADFGVDLIQGYLFSRPLPIDEFERLLTSRAPSFAAK